jgi:hypothetical protein
VETFDLSVLPQPVQDALLSLCAAMVEASTMTPAAPAIRQPKVVHRDDDDYLLEEVRQDQELFPRGKLELLILVTLQRLHPLPVSPRQLAEMLDLDVGRTRQVLAALWTLGTISHPVQGCYGHKAPSAIDVEEAMGE